MQKRKREAVNQAVMAFLFSVVFVFLFLSGSHSEEFKPGFTCITIRGNDLVKFLAWKSTKLQDISVLKFRSAKSWQACQHKFVEAIVEAIVPDSLSSILTHIIILASGIPVNVKKRSQHKADEAIVPCPLSSIPTHITILAHNKTRTKRGKSRIAYYSNITATYQLLMACGNVHPQPGPALTSTKIKQKRKPISSMPKCPICEKTVQRNQRRLECKKCFDLIHLRCAGVTSFNNVKAHLPG